MSIKKALEVEKIVLLAAQAAQPAIHFGRRFDNLFEDGDGKQVVIEFMKLFHKDDNLAKAAERMGHWLNLQNWQSIYEEWEAKNPTLF